MANVWKLFEFTSRMHSEVYFYTPFRIKGRATIFWCFLGRAIIFKEKHRGKLDGRQIFARKTGRARPKYRPSFYTGGSPMVLLNPPQKLYICGKGKSRHICGYMGKVEQPWQKLDINISFFWKFESEVRFCVAPLELLKMEHLLFWVHLASYKTVRFGVASISDVLKIEHCRFCPVVLNQHTHIGRI